MNPKHLILIEIFKKLAEEDKRRRAKNVERAIKWKKANRERVNERERMKRKEDKYKISERERKYREANREKLRERSKKYREANREEISERERALYERDKHKICNRNRSRLRWLIDSAHRVYLVKLLKRSGFPKELITDDLIELKRTEIKITRYLCQHQKTSKS